MPERLADRTVADLTARAARGDGRALGEIYDALFDHVLETARRITRRDESFALDIVQETFLRTARSIPPLAAHIDLERWLARVVRTTAIDALRRERRRQQHERVSVETRDRSVDTRERDAEVDELIAWIHAELETLPAVTRHAMKSRWVDGATLREIAERTGSTVFAVHGRIRRTVEALRQKARRMFGDVL